MKKIILVGLIILLTVVLVWFFIYRPIINSVYRWKVACERSDECPIDGLQGWYISNYVLIKDAGKVCTTHSDCESICITPLDDQLLVSTSSSSYSVEGYLLGKCHDKQRRYGCYYNTSPRQGPFSVDDVIKINDQRRIARGLKENPNPTPLGLEYLIETCVD